MTTSASSATAFRTCPLCEATCGLELTIRDREVVRIRGDRADVFSRGFICPKGTTLGRLETDPDRLTAPLIRTGATWQEASWEEAFAVVDARLTPILAEHGRDAVAVYLGNPNVHGMAGMLYLRPLLKSLATRNIFTAATVDQIPKHLSCGLMFGNPDRIPVPDLDRTDYLLMLGANPLASNGSLATAPDFPGRLEAICDRGGTVVVVDPRRSETAERADEHLFIRPGTDAHLLFGLVHTLVDDELVDLGDLAGHVDGMEAVADLSWHFSPEVVAPVTGVPAGTIRRIAHELAAAPTAVVYGRMGTSTVAFGTVASWLVDVLNVLTGNLDRPGGAMFPLPAHERVRTRRAGRTFEAGRWRSRVRDLPEVRGELPVATLADEIETPGGGQVRALVTIAGNPVLSTPNSGRLDAALASLELMVSVDPYLNETTRHADVILPPPGCLTAGHYDFAFMTLAVRNVANYSPPVFPLADGRPAEWEILVRLAGIAAGMGPAVDVAAMDQAMAEALIGSLVSDPSSPIHGRDATEIAAMLEPWRGPERLLELRLRSGPYGDGFGADPDGLNLRRLLDNPHGIDLGPLTARLPAILETPSGKVQLAPASIVQDVERLRADLGRPRNGDLMLVGRRHLRSNNSWMHNIDVLVKGKARCTLQVHPEDAARLGLIDGAPALVRSRVGAVRAPVEVTDGVMEGVVSLPHGWGHDAPGSRLTVAARRPGVNSNVLADEQDLDPLSGNAVLNGIPVTVEAVPMRAVLDNGAGMSAYFRNVE